MIRLTRLRHGETFLLNPDFIERIDSHVDTVVRLTNGSEYVVEESDLEILHRIGVFRAQVLATVAQVTPLPALPIHGEQYSDDLPELQPPHADTAAPHGGPR